MATDTRSTGWVPTPLTFAELCEAIAEERIAATVQGQEYVVSQRVLRRFIQHAPALPKLSTFDRSMSDYLTLDGDLATPPSSLEL